MLETVISIFSALGAFGNVAFLTVSAGFGRFAGRDVRSQGQMAANRSRRAGKRARRQAAVRSTRVRRRAMPNPQRAQLLASKLDRAKMRRGSAVAGGSAALAMGVAQRGRLLRAAGRLRARRSGSDGGASDGADREDAA